MPYQENLKTCVQLRDITFCTWVLCSPCKLIAVAEILGKILFTVFIDSLKYMVGLILKSRCLFSIFIRLNWPLNTHLGHKNLVSLKVSVQSLQNTLCIVVNMQHTIHATQDMWAIYDIIFGSSHWLQSQFWVSSEEIISHTAHATS